MEQELYRLPERKTDEVLISLAKNDSEWEPREAYMHFLREHGGDYPQQVLDEIANAYTSGWMNGMFSGRHSLIDEFIRMLGMPEDSSYQNVLDFLIVRGVKLDEEKV